MGRHKATPARAFLNLQMSLSYLRVYNYPLHDSWELFAFNLLLPFRFQILTLMPSCSSHLHLSCHWIPIGPYWLCPKGSLKAPLPARVSAHCSHIVVCFVENCPGEYHRLSSPFHLSFFSVWNLMEHWDARVMVYSVLKSKKRYEILNIWKIGGKKRDVLVHASNNHY